MKNFFEGEQIIFHEKESWGKTVRSPANEFAFVICELMGVNTITDSAVKRIKALGIPMVSVSELYELGRERMGE